MSFEGTTPAVKRRENRGARSSPHPGRRRYAPSIYVDDHGEEDVGLRRGAPLRLHRGRLEALEKLYASHGVAREVARLRAKSNRVIRDNYY